MYQEKKEGVSSALRIALMQNFKDLKNIHKKEQINVNSGRL